MKEKGRWLRLARRLARRLSRLHVNAHVQISLVASQHGSKDILEDLVVYQNAVLLGQTAYCKYNYKKCHA